jgi:hypothetical protein
MILLDSKPNLFKYDLALAKNIFLSKYDESFGGVNSMSL